MDEKLIAAYAAGYRAAQAAMPPREPTTAMLEAGRDYYDPITVWTVMHDAWTQEQTSGGVDGHAASVGQQAAASHPGRGRPEAAPTAGIKPGPLDHQSAATPSTSVGDDAQHGAAQAVTDGPAADPIDDLCARLYSLAKPHTYMLREEAAVVIERLRVERDEARRECVEQARLLGMSGSRAALLDKATPGPWATNGSRVECRDDHGWVNDGWIIGDLDGTDAEANSALIVAAVNALPELIARVRELEREREPRRDLSGSTHWDIAEVGAICHSECAITQLRDARRTAALAMRERCAQACEEAAQTRLSEGHDAPTMAAVCAAAIRQCAEGLR